MRLQLPIRLKIMFLVAGALTVSLASYLYVGTSLLVGDKVSYIYDHNRSEVKASSEVIENQIHRLRTVAKVIGQVSPELAQSSFSEHAKDLGISSMLILRPADDARFAVESKFGDTAATLEPILGELGWSPIVFQKEQLLVGASIGGKLPVGGSIMDSAGKPLAFLTLMELPASLTEQGSSQYQIRLVDAVGKALISQSTLGKTLDEGETEKFERGLAAGTFSSGAREVSISAEDYIVGYQRLASDRLLVLRYVPKASAFAASKMLAQRSLVLGLSILLLAVGLTLIFVKNLTSRLRQMWHATKKVADGDFSVRVPATGRSGDEIVDLASSFNVMADKIDHLMKETADKARMEKELETAQAVQSRFFPTKGFENASLKLAGRYIPASECAGDWWHYGQIGNSLIVLVGDVTGHGVSAALVTAAAHGAFNLLMKQLRDRKATVPDVRELLDHLNVAVHAAAGGEATMTFVISIVDLETGQMQLANAAHPPPFLLRATGGPAPKNPATRFKPLMDGRGEALGSAANVEITPVTIQLQAGDMLIWYTDGFMDQRPSDQRKLTKMELLKGWAARVDGAANDPSKTCDGIVGDVIEFFGPGAHARPDDITTVVATISPSVGWKAAPAPASSDAA